MKSRPDRSIRLLVSVNSISGNAAHRPDVFKMSAWLDGQLKELGVTTKLVDLGKHVMDGQELPLPPAILGRIGEDPKKKTVLIYGHYDVQPVSLVDLWPLPCLIMMLIAHSDRWV